MSVPTNCRRKGKLDVIVKTQDLVIHTVNISMNENVFVPKFKEPLTNDIIKTAKDIYFLCWRANNIRIKDEETAKKRRDLQNEAVLNCIVLLSMIDLAKRAFKLRNGKVQNWAKMVKECLTLIRAWRDSDPKHSGFG